MSDKPEPTPEEVDVAFAEIMSHEDMADVISALARYPIDEDGEPLYHPCTNDILRFTDEDGDQFTACYFETSNDNGRDYGMVFAVNEDAVIFPVETWPAVVHWINSRIEKAERRASADDEYEDDEYEDEDETGVV